MSPTPMTTFDFSDKVAIVTGSAGGIGQAYAEALAAAGASVVVADIDADKAAAVAAGIRDAGGSALAVTVDVADPASAQVKGLIRVGAGATANVIETFTGTGRTWTNAAMSVEVADKAHLGHYRLQDEAPAAFHTGTLDATIGADAVYDGFTLSLGAAMARQDINTRLIGDRAFCGVSGVYLLADRQESTVATVIEHIARDGRTKEVFKGCLADRSHGVFQGQIKVAQTAQKTDAYQLNKTILLGERAVMDAKPELEIFADDVKCSHGATVGDLDETAEFYLRSRGIAPEAARAMLIEAFVIDAVDLVAHEQARDYLTNAISRWLAARHPEK